VERRTVGSVEIIALIDTVQAYPATAIYPSAGDEVLRRFAAFMNADGAIELNFASFLLRDGGTTVLVDTGWGPEFNGRLLDELHAAGADPADVDVVTYTHLHGDHTGWNIDRTSGQPLFPRARYLVPKRDWDHYASQQPPPESFSRDVVPLEAMKRMELIDGETTLADSLVTLPTPGHTPGHTSVIVQSGGERGCILGDVVLTMVDARRPELDTSFDWDHPLARATREAMIARLASDGSLVGASHLPVPGFGRFTVSGGASNWTPA
jgi:glyoxylase-like metal-dependent hydrolase (beta-lactamase superfamily II)